MQKKILTVLLIVLCASCDREKSVSCTLYRDSKQLTLDISAINDDIKKIEVLEDYELPFSFVADEKAMKLFEQQLDEYCYFSENHLYRKYPLDLQEDYSLALSLDGLRKQRFICE